MQGKVVGCPQVVSGRETRADFSPNHADKTESCQMESGWLGAGLYSNSLSRAQQEDGRRVINTCQCRRCSSSSLEGIRSTRSVHGEGVSDQEQMVKKKKKSNGDISVRTIETVLGGTLGEKQKPCRSLLVGKDVRLLGPLCTVRRDETRWVKTRVEG